MIMLNKKISLSLSLSLSELSTPSNPPKYLSITINDDTLSKSLSSFSRYIRDEFLSSLYNCVYYMYYRLLIM